MIDWDAPDERYYHSGVDHGVLYPKGKPAVAWNGITGIDEVGNGSKTVHYRDGRIYYADVEPGDYEGSLTAFFFPDEFAECAGIPEVTDGLFVDNQKPKRFDLSYRTLIGSGATGDLFGYQIHLIYNAVAVIGTRSRKTLNESGDLMDFTFDITATPVKLAGMRPSAHYIIDTRKLGVSTIAQLEAILYDEGRMATPTELYDIMNFGTSITFIDHGNGTWTARGAAANVHYLDSEERTWEILNVNGTKTATTFTMQDTL